MILHHFQGPFNSGDSIIVPEKISFDTRVTGIHIECRAIQPGLMVTNNPPKYSLNYEEPVRETHDIPARSNMKDPIFEINTNGEKSSKYTLNERGILEFDGLYTTAVEITMLKNLPAETSIDVFVTEIEI